MDDKVTHPPTARALVDIIIDSISITATALGIEYTQALPLHGDARERLAMVAEQWYETRIHAEAQEAGSIPSSRQAQEAPKAACKLCDFYEGCEHEFLHTDKPDYPLAPKAASQSAENDACAIICGVSTAKGCKNLNLCSAALGCSKRIEAAFAAQRQAEREDAEANRPHFVLSDILSAVIESAREYLKEHSCSNSQGTCQDETNLRKALSDLDEARKG
jgi:hypothetical protein